MSYSRLYIFVAALLLAACDETTRVSSPDPVLDQPTLADADLPDLARAISKLRNIAELAIAVPMRHHRLHWRGGPEIGVAGAWNPDALGFVIHSPNGSRRRATTVRALMDYSAFFIIRPQENWGTRINRQPDAPGPVIQDRNDGERAVVWTYEVEGEPPVSVDHGRYASDASLQEAMASAGGQLPVAADSHCHGGQIPVDDECSDDDGGGVRGGVRLRPTYLVNFEMTGGGDFGSSSEVEVTVGYTNRNGVPVRGTIRREGVEQGQIVYIDDEVLPVSPHPGGQPFYVRAVETDSWLAGGNDDLGSATFGYTAGGRSFQLTSINLRLRW